jgi:8-oxo-dGTP diphosphatase
MLPKRFTVRCYGILQNSKGELLYTIEKINDQDFTKFPGGGLEFGEGPEDCVVREFEEETGLKVFCSRHIYTSGFFVQSAFDAEEQVIGIYYKVKPLDENILFDKILLKEKKQDFRGNQNIIKPIWISAKTPADEIHTFELDKVALAEFKKLSGISS